MKRLILFSFLIFSSFSLVFAQEETGVDEYLDDIEQGRQFYTYTEEGTQIQEPAIAYTIEASLEYAQYRYAEPGIDIKEKAELFGLNLNLIGRSHKDALIGRLESRFAYGRVHYTGFLSNGSPHTDEGNDYFAEVRALLGRDFKKANTILTPFFGFGYRYVNDQLESIYAYEREISYFYSPVGLYTESQLGGFWKWGIHAEYDIFWKGIVKSHFSDVNINYNDLRNEQYDGYGARASIFLKRDINKRFSFSIEPFFRYWDIDDSDDTLVTFAGFVVGVGREPANWTKEYGIKVSLFW